MDMVGVNHGDTLNTPQGNGTMGSRGLAVGGAAVVLALNKVRERAKAIAAQLLEASVGRYRDCRRQVPRAGRAGSGRDARGHRRRSVLRRPAGRVRGRAGGDRVLPARVDETYPLRHAHRGGRSLSRDGRSEAAALSSPSTTAGRSSARIWCAGRSMAGWRRGSGRRCWKRSSTTRSGELVTGTLNDYAIPRAYDFPSSRRTTRRRRPI